MGILTKTILIVDGAIADRTLYRHYLSQEFRYCYQFLEAATLESALLICQQENPDLLLFDYNLPDGNGLDLLAQLPRPLPSILLTKYSGKHIAIQAFSRGVADYLLKSSLSQSELCRSAYNTIIQAEINCQLTEAHHREQLFQQLALQIHQSLQLDTVLYTCVDGVREFLQVDRVLVYQFNPDFSGVVAAESVNPGWTSALHSEIQDTCFQIDRGALYSQGYHWAVNDIDAASLTDCHRQLLAQFEVRANLVVPILVRPEGLNHGLLPQHQPSQELPSCLWGLLIAHQCDRPREWQATELELMDQLARQLAIAIAQSTAYQQMQAELAERRRAEEALKRSEAINRAIIQAIPDLLLRMDCNGKYLDYFRDTFSHKNSKIIPVPPEIEQPFLHDVLPLPVVEQRLWYAQQAIATGEVQVYEQQLTIDGELCYEEVRIAVLGLNEVLAIIRDVTEQKRTALALQQLNQELEFRVVERTIALGESEERFRSLFEQSPIGIGITDLEGAFIRVNARLCQITGYGAAELLGLTMADVLHPVDRVTELALFQQLCQGDLQQSFQETRYITKTGEVIWVQVTGAAVYNSQGQLVCITNMVQDISDRKQIELALQQQVIKERLLGAVVQRIRNSLELDVILETAVEDARQILTADRVIAYQIQPNGSRKVVAEAKVEGQLSLLNYIFSEEIFPAPVYQRLEENLYIICDRDQEGLENSLAHFMEQWQIRAKLIVPIRQQENGQLWGVLVVHQCDRPRQWQSWEVEFMQQLADQYAIAIQQSELYHQLREANGHLVRATRHKDEFLANMSHELRTPLNTILGMAEGLQEEIFGLINSEQKRALSAIEQSGKHLLELIDDILNLAKIEAGRLELHKSSVSVDALCEASLAFVQQQARRKDIQLKTQLQPDLGNLLLDERRMRQILINLLSNAVKFTPDKGSIILEVKLTSASHLESIPPSLMFTNSIPLFVCFSVIDTGIGIAQADIHQLFQSFVQIDSRFNRQHTGTGLGLALVKRLTELHGGWVTVSSQVGQGSCFTVTLPYIPVITAATLKGAQNQLKPSTLEKPNLMETLPSPTILLIDNHEATVNTTISYLESRGYRLLCARTMQESLDRVAAYRPDLIVLDMQLLGTDSSEVIAHLCCPTRFPRIPIIAITASPISNSDRSLLPNDSEYLTKPIRLQQLADKIQKLIQR